MVCEYRHGNTKPVSVPVESATVISRGDLVWMDTNGVKPASAFTWDTNIATTQAAFTPKFLGVSMNDSRAGDVEPITVNRAGVFEFDCASASFAVGALAGSAKASGNNMENQKAVSVATANLAIGRVFKATTSATKVLIEIVSGVFGGTQTIPS